MHGPNKYEVTTQQLKQLTGFENLSDEEADNINAQFRELSLLVASIVLREWCIYSKSINANSYETDGRAFNL
ncbi:MAG: hypothetical protein JWQ09_3558 [Segetibacter sp.]|nr:hypothetical protein [Segetibacter sp.]